MILGYSGSGKSASLRNLDPKKTMIVQPVTKPLPFRNKFDKFNKETKEGSLITLKNPIHISTLLKALPSLGKEILVIDDMQYIMLDEYIVRSDEKGFQKFTDIAKATYNLITQANESDIRCYFLWHPMVSAEEIIRPKTLGRFLEEKVTVEGLFTTVLMAEYVNEEFMFRTQKDKNDVIKAPFDMFEQRYIPNDLAVVDDIIKAYYS